MAGWTGSSNMAGVYVHLSGADVERKILEQHSFTTTEQNHPEDNPLKTKNCPRCRQTNPATAQYCYTCGTPLTPPKPIDDIQNLTQLIQQDPILAIQLIKQQHTPTPTQPLTPTP